MDSSSAENSLSAIRTMLPSHRYSSIKHSRIDNRRKLLTAQLGIAGIAGLLRKQKVGIWVLELAGHMAALSERRMLMCFAGMGQSVQRAAGGSFLAGQRGD